MKGIILAMVVAVAATIFIGCGQNDNSSKNSIYIDKIPAIKTMVADVMAQEKLKSVLLGITIGGKELLLMADGESTDGIPATPDMHLRNGSVAIAYMGYLFYRLVDDGIINANDPVGKWLPDLPDSQLVTLEMLINCTSGYPDYVPMDAFRERLYADPSHQWSPEELIALSFTQASKFAPGSNFNYAHTNYVILGLALEKATGKPLDELMQTYLFTPFGMTQTEAPNTPYIPDPVLHSYTDERGYYEDATFWNPSWTLARGAVQTSTIRDTLTAFRAIGRGDGLTTASFESMLAPHTAHMKSWTQQLYYAQGVLVNHGWLIQTPSFAGLFGAAGYFADKDITIAIWCTKSIESENDSNTASAIFKQLTTIFTPQNPLK